MPNHVATPKIAKPSVLSVFDMLPNYDYVDSSQYIIAVTRGRFTP